MSPINGEMLQILKNRTKKKKEKLDEIKKKKIKDY